MYIPDKMSIESPEEVSRVIESHSFATLVSGDLQATHLPLVLDCEKHCLLGHFARANRHWKSLDGEPVLAIFAGPHAYISPGWYDQKPAVPTWNYVAVHVYGSLRIVDRERTNEIMDTMLAFFEPSLLESRDVVTPAIQQQMLSAIVGCEISIDRIEAKEKLGQLRSVDDQRGTVAGLSATQRRDAGALLDYMNDRKLGIGNSDT